MGLDTTHGCWHGGYISFNVWRNKLAEVAGYRIKKMEGYPIPEIEWDKITYDNLAGIWDKTPDDPLVVLIAHADCDGKISPAQAEPLAKRLEELLPLLPEGDGGGHIGDWRDKTQTFINGLRLAVSKGEDVRFG